MRRFLRNIGLSLVLAVLFIVTYIGGQLIAGWKVPNHERAEHQEDALGVGEYFVSAHNLEVLDLLAMGGTREHNAPSPD